MTNAKTNPIQRNKKQWKYEYVMPKLYWRFKLLPQRRLLKNQLFDRLIHGKDQVLSAVLVQRRQEETLFPRNWSTIKRSRKSTP